LIIWQEEQILLDGHNRYAICTQHGIAYGRHEISLPDWDSAQLWILRHQRGRRNATPNQLSYMRGKEYEIQKRQGKRTDLTSGNSYQKFPSTATALAQEHQRSEKTIRNDFAYVKALDTLAEAVGKEVRDKVRDHDLKLTQTEVRALAKMAPQYSYAVKEAIAAVEGAKTPKQARQIVRQTIREAREHTAEMDERCRSEYDADLGLIPPPQPPAPVLVLEPEAPEGDEMTASTLTERERAYLGPRTDKPPGSVAWCWQTIALMKSRWEQRTLDDEGFKALVDELRRHEAWNVVPPEEPYGSLEALLGAELGLDQQRLHDEALLPSKVDNALHEALWHLESLEVYYRATPQLFALHQQGYLAVKDACVRFAALFDPAEPPAPAPAPDAATSAPAPAIPPYDAAKFVLGKLCAGQHEYGQTGQTLLRKNGRYCSVCKQALDSLRRKGLLPRLKNDRAICWLGWLFCLELCRFCL
jgi:hypothetical protein